MQHSTGQYDDLARVPRARPREGGCRRTTASRHRRHSPARCSGRVVPPIRDARFVDLNRRSSCAAQPKAPGTGLQSPETGRQNRRYRDLSRQQRPHVPHLNSRKRPQIAGYSSETGKHRFASVCVVVDAARIEPVSTSNSLLAGNLAGNFLKKGLRGAILASKTRAGSIAYERIPCSAEQGIFLLEQGIFSREQGILRVDGPPPS